MTIDIDEQERDFICRVARGEVERKAKLLRTVLGSAEEVDLKVGAYWLHDLYRAKGLLEKLGETTDEEPAFGYKEGLIVEGNEIERRQG